MRNTDRLDNLLPEITEWRRDMHRHPELGYEVQRTAGFVADKLRGFGFDEVVEGVGRTGVVGVIKGRSSDSGKVIGLRADMDVIVAVGAGTDSGVNRMRFNNWDLPAVADFGLLRSVVEAAEAAGQTPHVGTIFTSDFFYDPVEGKFDLLEKYGVLAVEMEAAGLYGLAAELGKKALTVCTVSDQIKRNEAMSTEDRQTSFNDMITMVLDATLNV